VKATSPTLLKVEKQKSLISVMWMIEEQPRPLQIFRMQNITKTSESCSTKSTNTSMLFLFYTDHNHAVQAMAAMQLGKHVYVQKPLTHDIYEARMLTEAAKKYKVVTQMGNQGASNDGCVN